MLLILAGVSIATLTGPNGLLTRTNDAKIETEETKKDELRKLTQAEAATYFEEHEYTDANGKKVTIPAQCAVSQLEGENTLEDGLVIIDINGNSWVWIEVPKNTTVYSNAGLDVTDFSKEECIKIYNDLKAYTIGYKTGFEEWTDSYYSECGIDSEKIYDDLKNSMIKSIYQNEGFWIGQYEVGSMTYVTSEDNGDRKPVIKEGAYPYNYVTCSQAQKIAMTLGVENKTSSLMFGIQWDLVMKFLESKSKKSPDELKVNSSSWGNYKDSKFDIVKGEYSTDNGNTYFGVDEIYKKSSGTPIITTTGATDRNSTLNIYDLAGNMWEWTLEYSTIGGEPHTLRAGNFYQNGDVRPAFYRFEATTSYSYWSIGFRIALY